MNVTDVSTANDAMEDDPNVIYFQTHIAGELELKGYPCVLTNAPRTYLENSLAFSFPKNSPYRKLFSYFLLTMRQSGQIQRLYDMHTRRINTLKQVHKDCMKKPKTFFQTCRPNEPNCVPAINIKIVITALIIMIGGALFAILIAMIERMDYNNQLNVCTNLKNNIPTKYFMRKRGVLVFSSTVLFISLIVVVSLLAYHTIASDHDHITYNEFQQSNDT